MFRSTGSYEPDPADNCINAAPWVRFDPQALTSLTLSAWGLVVPETMFRSTGSYEPDPAAPPQGGFLSLLFRSTGSYEPDP